MKKIFIDFEMKSIDSQVKFNAIGEFDNKRIKFIDEELNKNNIVIHKHAVEYSKTGTMDMKFVFDINNASTGTYQVDNNTFKFDIVTTKLVNTSNGLIIKYKLYQDNELVNESLLSIKYTFTEEELLC